MKKIQTSKPKIISDHFTVYGKPEGTGKRNVAFHEYLRTIPRNYGTDIDFVGYSYKEERPTFMLEAKSSRGYVTPFQRMIFEAFAEQMGIECYATKQNVDVIPLDWKNWRFTTENLVTGKESKVQDEADYRGFLTGLL